ncbi:malonyl-CoA decarboxylase [Microbaculum marinum]|uniref:Malonyl-CoA decarboxylase n=1 Tax=Microbaculum marinum TaxID=1764581 RepID=A0AAW9RYB9_9HYPH
MTSYFFNDLLSTIVDRGRGIVERGRDRRPSGQNLAGLANDLLSGRGEATGIALARDLFDNYATLDSAGRTAFFRALASEFGPDPEALAAAAEAYLKEPGEATALRLHQASEPRRQELIRRLNRAPGGTAALVAMREDLLDRLPDHPDFRPVDADFSHLLSSWFNRGFLVLRRIDWSMPASTLEKIIRYEAVHEINGWDDLRRRIDPPDRRLFAFFHPALVDEPLIFVEVALTAAIPEAIGPILAEDHHPIDPAQATTAVFYSISNCQKGLRGISFGNFLIKQVVEELARAFPSLKTFVTLSPAPTFRKWVERQVADEAAGTLRAGDREVLATLEDAAWAGDPATAERARPVLLRLAAQYYLQARTDRGTPPDPVARFHLGNGARLEQLDFLGDPSPKGLGESYGLMVNYLYDPKTIERNHEAFANKGEVVASTAVKRQLRGAPEVTQAIALSA